MAPLSYTADVDGVTEVSQFITGYSLHGDVLPSVAGRAVIVKGSVGSYIASGDRVGCGVVIPSKAEVALIGTYPGYTGSQSVRGVLVLSETQTSLTIKGTLTGLQKNVSGGWHVHAGKLGRA